MYIKRNKHLVLSFKVFMCARVSKQKQLCNNRYFCRTTDLRSARTHPSFDGRVAATATEFIRAVRADAAQNDGARVSRIGHRRSVALDTRVKLSNSSHAL